MTFLTKRNIIIAVFAAAVLIPVGYFAVRSLQTFPVGNNTDIVYLGRDTVGSWLPMSSMSPTDRYYYGTDMTPEELAEYLGGEITHSDGPGTARYSIDTSGSQYITVMFYFDKESTEGSPLPSAKHSSKKYFFYTLQDYYEILKQATDK